MERSRTGGEDLGSGTGNEDWGEEERFGEGGDKGSLRSDSGDGSSARMGSELDSREGSARVGGGCSGFSGGLREGSKLTILILGSRISVVSNSIAFAVRFLFLGVDDEDGEEEDIGKNKRMKRSLMRENMRGKDREEKKKGLRCTDLVLCEWFLVCVLISWLVDLRVAIQTK